MFFKFLDFIRNFDEYLFKLFLNFLIITADQLRQDWHQIQQEIVIALKRMSESH